MSCPHVCKCHALAVMGMRARAAAEGYVELATVPIPTTRDAIARTTLLRVSMWEESLVQAAIASEIEQERTTLCPGKCS